MSLKDMVVKVLNGPNVARIRFRFPVRGGVVTIAPQTFQLVAHAIQSGRVFVEPAKDLRAGVAAQYNGTPSLRADRSVLRANTLQIKMVSGRVNEGHIVHESLHAAYDLLMSGIDDNAEEASCYVCSALYVYMTGLHKRLETAKSAIWHSAGLVAKNLIDQYQKGDPGIPMVDEHEWRTLRTAVGLDPYYADTLAGILTGWVLGMHSIRDG